MHSRVKMTPRKSNILIYSSEVLLSRDFQCPILVIVDDLHAGLNLHNLLCHDHDIHLIYYESRILRPRGPYGAQFRYRPAPEYGG